MESEVVTLKAATMYETWRKVRIQQEKDLNPDVDFWLEHWISLEDQEKEPWIAAAEAAMTIRCPDCCADILLEPHIVSVRHRV